MLEVSTLALTLTLLLLLELLDPVSTLALTLTFDALALASTLVELFEPFEPVSTLALTFTLELLLLSLTLELPDPTSMLAVTLDEPASRLTADSTRPVEPPAGPAPASTPVCTVRPDVSPWTLTAAPGETATEADAPDPVGSLPPTSTPGLVA